MKSVPEVWKKLGKYLHQDYMLDYPDFWSGIDDFSSGLDSPDQERLIQYLESLVNNEHPGGTLKKVWRESGSQIAVAAASTREFYVDLLNHVRCQRR